jgi:hypothetical protein
MDAVMGPLTRRALQTFQHQNGLPPTGDLDAATVQALQAACTGAAPTPLPSQPTEPPAGPPPDAAAPPAPDAAAPPPDGGAAPGDGADGAPAPAAPADGAEPQGEILLGRHEGESEQEFVVDGAARVEVEPHEPVPLDRDPQFSWAPDAPGLYVIYVNNEPWYVGIAEFSIRQRFLQRRKVLDDLRIPLSALANRSVSWYLLRSSAAPGGAILRRQRGNSQAHFRPLFGKYAILRILEQVFIKRLKNPKGNQLTELVRFTPRGSHVIVENGAKTAEYPPNSQV